MSQVELEPSESCGQFQAKSEKTSLPNELPNVKGIQGENEGMLPSISFSVQSASCSG